MMNSYISKQKKETSYRTSLFCFEGEEGIHPLRVLTACRPKCFAFRYPTAHQHAKNDYQSFSERVLPPRCSNPFYSYSKQKKRHPIGHLFFVLKERKGFEPSKRFKPFTAFPMLRLQPAQPPLQATLLLYQ